MPVKAMLLPLMMLFAAGCATSPAYWTNRARDAADVFTVCVGVGAGAKVRVGPFCPALIMQQNYAGVAGGDSFVGLESSTRGSGFHGAEFIVLWGADYGNHSDLAQARGKYHEAFYLFGMPMPFAATDKPPRTYNASYFTQIEFVAGLGGTVKLGFNPGELLDFMLGWFGVDIYGDDIAEDPVEQARLPLQPLDD